MAAARGCVGLAMQLFYIYIAHFAIRNNNNLFYRFPKTEAGREPETKRFIGVALQ